MLDAHLTQWSLTICLVPLPALSRVHTLGVVPGLPVLPVHDGTQALGRAREQEAGPDKAHAITPAQHTRTHTRTHQREKTDRKGEKEKERDNGGTAPGLAMFPAVRRRA